MSSAFVQAKPEADSQDPVHKAEVRECRICFEKGGADLIAPCMCDGTSKWVHRTCLNKWRVSNANPRSMLECCECRFQYQLELQRTDDIYIDEMRRQFTRQLLSHSFLWCLGVQLIIIVLGIIIKLIDSGDMLVRLLHSIHLEKAAKVYGFFPELQHYALAYYLSGIVALLLIIGVMVLSDMCCGMRPPLTSCAVCVEGCELCIMCDPMLCGEVDFIFLAQCCELACSAGSVEVLLIFGIFILAGIVVIGLISVVVAIVMIVVRVVQRYVRLRELGMLAEQYHVKDLAASQPDNSKPVQHDMEKGLVGPPASVGEDTQQEIQRLVEEELQAILGGSLPAENRVPLAPRLNREGGYGSTGTSLTGG